VAEGNDERSAESAVGTADHEVMALVVTANADLLAGVLRASGRGPGESVLAALAATRSLGIVVDDTLRALVRQARAQGRTWAEIGEVLHVTRQAAFQRFGGDSAPAPDAGSETSPLAPLPGAADRGRAVLEDFVQQRWDAVRARFDQRMLDACPVELLERAWHQHLEPLGAVLEFGVPQVGMRLAYTVADVPLALERGDLKGRVAFDADGQVSGFFLLPTDAP
jgi:hypothetical protein